MTRVPRWDHGREQRSGVPQAVRTVRHLAMWYQLLFALIHIYMAFREDIMGESSIVSTMVNGIRMWKDEPRKG